MTDEAIRAALSDFDAFWLTVWAEGRGEPIEGQIAIACTIRNRVQTPQRFGATYKTVCLARKQFSCWNEGTDRNHVRLMQLAQSVVDDYAVRSTLPRDPVMTQIQYLAQGIMGGQLMDRSAGADHYLTTELLLKQPPSWAKGRTPVAMIGQHAFLKIG